MAVPHPPMPEEKIATETAPAPAGAASEAGGAQLMKLSEDVAKLADLVAQLAVANAQAAASASTPQVIQMPAAAAAPAPVAVAAAKPAVGGMRVDENCLSAFVPIPEPLTLVESVSSVAF